jgi:hypothetical protein
MAELKSSILSHGLRLPIEVFELAIPQNGKRYGLISGYRRLNAIISLAAETGRPDFRAIRALIRRPEGAAEAFVADTFRCSCWYSSGVVSLGGRDSEVPANSGSISLFMLKPLLGHQKPTKARH